MTVNLGKESQTRLADDGPIYYFVIENLSLIEKYFIH